MHRPHQDLQNLKFSCLLSLSVCSQSGPPICTSFWAFFRDFKALRALNCPNTYTKNVNYIELDSCLSFSNKHTKLRSKVLRDKISSVEDPKSLAPMRKWGRELDHTHSVDWISVFSNLFFSLTNHFKLIQFHYKLWHRISTCRFMRHKMRIDLDSPRCSLCNGDIETLEHIIFLNCYHTQEFV